MKGAGLLFGGKEPKLSMKTLESFKPRHDINLNTHISIKNQYIYLQVGKAASSTVRYYLQKKEFCGTRWKVQNVNNRHLSPHIAPYQLGDKLFLQLIENPDFKKICFVRNPYTRLLSCYLHRIVADSESSSAKIFYKLSAYPKNKTPSFGDFLRFICQQESKKMERHWRVQSDEVFFDVINIGFIGQMENLSNNLEALGKYLFGNEGFGEEKLGEIDQSPMKTNSNNKIREYYNSELATLVAERYQKDFINFGYSFDLPVN